MGVVGLIRLVAFATVLLFSLVPLGIGANFVALGFTSLYSGSVGGFAVAVGVITLITIPAILIVDHLRKGAIVSTIWFELLWVGLLSILWVACAGHATAQLFGVTLSCDVFFNDEAASICRQYQALQAFSWLNWLILFGWFWFLLITSLIGMTRNKRVWFGTAGDVLNKAPKTDTYPAAGGYPPQNQGYGTPQQPGFGGPQYQQPQMTGATYPPAGAPYQGGQTYAPPPNQPYGV